jgi:hypothetical protein
MENLNDHDIFFKQISNMLYFSESCVEVKIHDEPLNFVRKKGNTKTTCFVSINVQFSTITGRMYFF